MALELLAGIVRNGGFPSSSITTPSVPPVAKRSDWLKSAPVAAAPTVILVRLRPAGWVIAVTNPWTGWEFPITTDTAAGTPNVPVLEVIENLPVGAGRRVTLPVVSTR